MSTGTATADPPAPTATATSTPSTVADWANVTQAAEGKVSEDQARIASDQAQLATDQSAVKLYHDGLDKAVNSYGGMPVVMVDLTTHRATVFVPIPGGGTQILSAAIATDPIPVPPAAVPAAPAGDGTAPASPAS